MPRKPSWEQFTPTLGTVHPNLVFLPVFVLSTFAVPEPVLEILLDGCCAHRVVGSQQPGGLKKPWAARGQGKSPRCHKDQRHNKQPGSTLMLGKTHCKKMHQISLSQTRSNQMGAFSPSKSSNVPKGIRMIPLVFPKFKPVL